MTLPEVPVDTILRLEADDWFPREGQPGAGEPLTVQVRRVHPAGEGVAYVVGHRPECSHEGSDCDQPWCVEVIASVAALERAAKPEA